MSEISETEIKAMTKEQNYMRGYEDGKSDALNKIRVEIETEYGQCDICEYFEDYDYEENAISEYRPIGNVADILQIIDKYKAESEKKEEISKDDDMKIDIPNNITNGELLEKLFPQIAECKHKLEEQITLNSVPITFSLEWWNRKYGEL